MRNRLADPNDLNRIILHLDAHPTPAKCKVFPYLRSMNLDQPIDYRIYEKLRKNRKVQVLKPDQPSSLFLEGEVAYSAPRENRQHKNRDHVLQLLTPHRTSKIIKSITDKIIPECQLVPAQREGTGREI
jgi:hypothetical protein